MTNPRNGARARAFTLIEMLVVIGIISVLATLVIAAMQSTLRRSSKTATFLLIQTLEQKLDAYQLEYGAYPPSRPAEVGLVTNGVNDGVKCLVRCLSSQRKPGGPYFLFEGDVLLSITDDRLPDGRNPTGSIFLKPDLLELVDEFRRSLIYLNAADYDKGQTVQLEQGGPRIKVVGVRSKATGQHEGFGKYQLWSVGANGQDEAGEGDDVTSWGKR